MSTYDRPQAPLYEDDEDYSSYYSEDNSDVQESEGSYEYVDPNDLQSGDELESSDAQQLAYSEDSQNEYESESEEYESESEEYESESED
jgi:hypothetical protein